MQRVRNALAVVATAGGLVLATPAAAQTFAEPAQMAQPVNPAEWQREVARDFPAIQRFEGVPELRFGFVVDREGRVRTCMALAAVGAAQGPGQALCPAFIEHAEFAPARDAEGQAIDSVFILRFEPTRPVVVIDYAGLPIS